MYVSKVVPPSDFRPYVQQTDWLKMRFQQTTKAVDNIIRTDHVAIIGKDGSIRIPPEDESWNQIVNVVRILKSQLPPIDN